jgi:hypothetical protein
LRKSKGFNCPEWFSKNTEKAKSHEFGLFFPSPYLKMTSVVLRHGWKKPKNGIFLRIGDLRRLAFGLGAALVLLLLLGTGLGFSLYFQAQNRRVQEAVARQQALEAVERELKEAKKLKAQP